MWILNVLSLLLLSSIKFVASVPRSGPFIPSSAGANYGKILVKGVGWKTPDGHVPIRREVRDLKNNFPDIWNIYILGLRSFQLSEEAESRSYYKIAGIHGRPYKAWEGAEGKPGKDPAGYCTHNSALFSSWHRPYLALYEQELYKHVVDVAVQFPSELLPRYTAAAKEFRIPYWDWALGSSGGGVPDVFTSPTVDVIGPDGQAQTLQNPLHHFEFHPLIAGDLDFGNGRFGQLNQTLRWPDSSAPDANSRNDKYVQDFNTWVTMLHDQVSDGFSGGVGLNTFSKTYLENPHGWVHNIIGGLEEPQGHMAPIETSAYEPLFALHHCNVDRILALWEAVHPGLDIEPEIILTGGDNWWLDVGDTVNTDSELPPFWKTDTTFWKVSEVRDTQVFGYAYPETRNWTFSSVEAYGASVNATIARLYSNSARGSLTAMATETGGPNLNYLLENNYYTDWSIKVRAAPSALPSTFIMRFSLVGTFSSDAVTPVGAWHVLMSDKHKETAHKSKRGSSLENQLEGHIGLTPALLTEIAAGRLESLDAVEVVPFLKERLTWKATLGAVPVPHNELHDTTIIVSSRMVRIPESADQPLEYSAESTPYPEVTAGKSGVAKG